MSLSKDEAATQIQASWRGYYTRNRDATVVAALRRLRDSRQAAWNYALAHAAESQRRLNEARVGGLEEELAQLRLLLHQKDEGSASAEALGLQFIESGDGGGVLRWDSPERPTGDVAVLVDGEEVGVVGAARRQATLADLGPGRHTFQLRLGFARRSETITALFVTNSVSLE